MLSCSFVLKMYYKAYFVKFLWVGWFCGGGLEICPVYRINTGFLGFGYVFFGLVFLGFGLEI